MATRSIEWLAGLLEGEACFSLDPSQGASYLRVKLAMTDEDVVRVLLPRSSLEVVR